MATSDSIRNKSKRRPVDLDGRPRCDSSSRSIQTDLGLDLGPVEGEATLLFAHLREALAELVKDRPDDGDYHEEG